MTETSPLGSVARPPRGVTGDEAWRVPGHRRAGCSAPSKDRLVGDGGDVLPNDGEAVGEVEVRGPWITGSYYKDDDPEKFHDGWLRTGDVGTIDRLGYVTLTDRAKDVIKSGGEWISSMELENILMASPGGGRGGRHRGPRREVGRAPAGHGGAQGRCRRSRRRSCKAYLADRIPRWQLPERWSIIEEVPKTSVGKVCQDPDPGGLRGRRLRRGRGTSDWFWYWPAAGPPGQARLTPARLFLVQCANCFGTSGGIPVR